MIGAAGRQRLQRPALWIELQDAHAFRKDVRVVARRPIGVRRRRLDLRVEPIRERGETAQQQHG